MYLLVLYYLLLTSGEVKYVSPHMFPDRTVCEDMAKSAKDYIEAKYKTKEHVLTFHKCHYIPAGV